MKLLLSCNLCPHSQKRNRFLEKLKNETSNCDHLQNWHTLSTSNYYCVLPVCQFYSIICFPSLSLSLAAAFFTLRHIPNIPRIHESWRNIAGMLIYVCLCATFPFRHIVYTNINTTRFRFDIHYPSHGVFDCLPVCLRPNNTSGIWIFNDVIRDIYIYSAERAPNLHISKIHTSLWDVFCYRMPFVYEMTAQYTQHIW